MILLKDLGMQYSLTDPKRKYRFGLYECTSCGNEFKRRQTKPRLLSNCISCARRVPRTHGKSGTRLYNIWCNMKNRCAKRINKHKSHQRYVDTGIEVCTEWANYYELFEKWALQSGYKDTLTIDRIEGTKGYYPENCRWATHALQAQNTIKINSVNTTGYRGVGRNKNRKKFGVQIRVEGKRIWLGAFDTPLEGAKAYDKYVIDNKLSHTINGV